MTSTVTTKEIFPQKRVFMTSLNHTKVYYIAGWELTGWKWSQEAKSMR